MAKLDLSKLQKDSTNNPSTYSDQRNYEAINYDKQSLKSDVLKQSKKGSLVNLGEMSMFNEEMMQHSKIMTENHQDNSVLNLSDLIMNTSNHPGGGASGIL